MKFDIRKSEYMSGGQAGNLFLVTIIGLTRSNSQTKSENLLYSLNFPGESEAKLYYFQGNSKRKRNEIFVRFAKSERFSTSADSQHKVLQIQISDHTSQPYTPLQMPDNCCWNKIAFSALQPPPCFLRYSTTEKLRPDLLLHLISRF